MLRSITCHSIQYDCIMHCWLYLYAPVWLTIRRCYLYFTIMTKGHKTDPLHTTAILNPIFEDLTYGNGSNNGNAPIENWGI